MKKYIIAVILIFVSFFGHGQKEITLNMMDRVKIDSALLILTLCDPCTKWYFHLDSFDTIYLVENYFTEDILHVDFSDIVGKIVVFIPHEKKPPFSPIFRPRIWLEVLLVIEYRRTTKVFIGKHPNYRVGITFKKKGKKYKKIECVVT